MVFWWEETLSCGGVERNGGEFVGPVSSVSGQCFLCDDVSVVRDRFELLQKAQCEAYMYCNPYIE